MAPFEVSEVVPGADLTTDDEILDWVKQAAETTYHPVGTCSPTRNALVSEIRRDCKELAGVGWDDCAIETAFYPNLSAG